MNMCLVLGAITLVQGACDSQAKVKCSTTPSSDVELPPGVHLFQSSVGRSVMRTDNAMGLLMDDLEESLHRHPGGVKPLASRVDHAFYLGMCLDMLICLIIIEGWRRFRKSKRQQSVAPSKTGKVAVTKNDEKDDPEAHTLALRAAVCKGDAENCEALLRNTDVSTTRLLTEGDNWGRTVLHLAALRGSEPMTGLLLKLGAKVDALDAWDHSPLHCAAYSSSLECCRLLIQHGAAVNVTDAGERTPLHVAADLGHESVCRLLLEHGGTLSKDNTRDVPPLLSALLVERMFQKLPETANAPTNPGMFERSSTNRTEESDDGWQTDSFEDGFYDPEEEW